MVLKPARGVTLLELLIAVSLAGLVVGMALALYKDVARAAGLAGGRMQGDFRAQAQFAALARNVKYGAGILRLAPDAVDLLNIRGRRLAYAWRDSTLSVNGEPRPFKITSLAVEPWGPPIPKGPDGEPDWNEAPALDSLDEDRDGAIDFDELDRDGDGELDMEEARFIAQVRLTLALPGAVPSVRTLIVHPRNRARDSLAAPDSAQAESDPLAPGP